GNSRSSVIRDAVSFRPVQPINWTADDESSIEDTDPYLFDPVKTISNTERSRIDDVLSGTLGFNVRFLKKFECSTIGNYRTSLRENNTFYQKNTYQASRTSLGINGTIANNRWDILSTSNTLRFK